MVKFLNRDFYDEMIKELVEGFEKLSLKFDHYSIGVMPQPQRINIRGEVFPFPLAAEIHAIYMYLAGLSEPPNHMYNTLKSICGLVWGNPFTNKADYQIEWEQWERTKLGLFVRCSFIALSLEAEESINSKQLSLMVGLSSVAIIKTIKEGKLDASKDGRQWVIPSDDALAFIQLQVTGKGYQR
ncbi:helix-turn-helix domain-containing protein [Neobacillus sp. PS3-12]|uniref:helix-turn-helix domain-containing protein n=1 Tax=Neobacillus sp. PS3-12 TaxID=3070677 RepID=UPI0027DEE566|nr:helix-turn-helix domain-containing protein [Neobacillus sp. PS3-12]WML54344.1 helix-turn-helix domain-containing protein [Neobacillus sp. PS3-12]